MISRLAPDDFPATVKSLADLLVDVVAGGASLGFRFPFRQEEAAAWWRTQQPAVSDGTMTIWVAHGPGGVVGTISLVVDRKPNGRHRADVIKLMVHPDARGQGLARALLATAEQAAAQAGVTLLLLDTVTGSAADHLYEGAGWTRFGIVPDYATDPGGTLEDCSFFYKQLT
ncbi:N-acetyltransferase [Planotetraspora thailandica]|uniref:N-acetyltransferase n=1 Tax=Planotetraspora thailandica TaxID=487172 RepID=A0A8J4DE80_9ACTN|nr:GNAT family N-acetyltransferase [Planotetraspora thailandica]GII58590.1 N-acetyltransferase [Planotetraspora thailandica]